MRPCLVIVLMMVSLAAAAAARAEPLGQRTGWQVLATEKTFDRLSADLSEAIKAEGMLLVSQASASAGAKGRGLTIPGNRVVGVYRNDYAVRMLEASVAAGIEAPIRFYVTEGEDGMATLSWKTPSHVFSPYMDEGGERLKDLADELDAVFNEIAETAVAPR